MERSAQSRDSDELGATLFCDYCALDIVRTEAATVIFWGPSKTLLPRLSTLGEVSTSTRFRRTENEPVL